MQTALRTATWEDLRWIERAVRRCPRTMADMGAFYGEAAVRLPPLLGPDREMLLILTDDEPVGFLDLDTDRLSDSTHLTYFIAPDRRRHGMGLGALRALADARPGRRFVAAVGPDNEASMALARAAGFVASGVTEWGDVVLIRAGEDTPPR